MVKNPLTNPKEYDIIKAQKRKELITMKEQIKEILAHHPNGLRLREIAMYLQVNRFSLINLLDELKKEGVITGVGVNNFVQGESYILWKLAK